ncbi:DUF732 domain-containing protein [Gordonia sp. 852002-51296_SCH5728562-b]|nr:DUF732 domain-containing protein [Gordonia sp. 852002-51296_SCH5728562-b]
MMRKFFGLGVMVAGLALAGGLTACSDDSTASAPITSDPVTTTSMYSSPSSSAAKSSESERASSEAAAPGGTKVSGSTTLPATAPNSGTKVPENFPGPGGEPVSDKGKKYLQVLKDENVSFAGDSDNSVALNSAEYVCSQQAKGADPTTVKAFVTAMIGPSSKNAADANSKADKVIKAARDNYC